MEKMSIEHIRPRSQRPIPSGQNGWKNHARACQSCNNSRGTTPFLIWILTMQKKWGYFHKHHPFVLRRVAR